MFSALFAPKNTNVIKSCSRCKLNDNLHYLSCPYGLRHAIEQSKSIVPYDIYKLHDICDKIFLTTSDIDFEGDGERHVEKFCIDVDKILTTNELCHRFGIPNNVVESVGTISHFEISVVVYRDGFKEYHLASYYIPFIGKTQYIKYTLDVFETVIGIFNQLALLQSS